MSINEITRKFWPFASWGLVGLGCIGLAACGARTNEFRIPPSPSGYHAVFMAHNNVVLYGKLDAVDGQMVKLSEVHYVRSSVNKETQEVSNQLIKRGQEWHKPVETFLQKDHIMMIEPVAEDSKVLSILRERK